MSTRLVVGEAAVARIAAATARQMPGVAALRPDLGPTLPGPAGSLLGGPGRTTAGATAVVRGRQAEIVLTLVTTLGHNPRDLAAAVQRAVAGRLRADTGLDAVVTVTIADIEL